MRNLGKTLLAVAFLSFPSLGQAATVIGGDTRVAFGSILSGLEVGLSGTASQVGSEPGLTVNFGITGGDLDAALAGTIRHDGSGITLSNGVNTLALGNFVINTTTSFLQGDAALNGAMLGTGLDLFTFDLGSVSLAELTDLDNPLLALLIAPTASGALDSAFGTGNTTGLQLGLAATAPRLGVVPEPESWAMLIVGFGLVGAVARFRQDRTRRRIAI